MTEDFQLNTFVAIDCEYVTHSGRFYAWQIGLHKFMNGQLVTKWTSYIKPPEKAFEILNDKKKNMVKEAPSFEQIVTDLEKFISDTKLIVVYGMSDKKVLEKEFNRLSRKLPKSYWLDLYIFCANVYGKNYNLQQSCEKVKISHFLAHDAEADSLATSYLYSRLLDNFTFKSGKEFFNRTNCNIVDETNKRLYNKITYKNSYFHPITKTYPRMLIGGEIEDRIMESFDENKIVDLLNKNLKFVGNFKNEKFGINRQKILCLKYGINYVLTEKEIPDIIVYSTFMSPDEEKYINEMKAKNMIVCDFSSFHKKYRKIIPLKKKIVNFFKRVGNFFNTSYVTMKNRYKVSVSKKDQIFVSPNMIVE